MRIDFRYKVNAVVEHRIRISVPVKVLAAGPEAMCKWALAHLEDREFHTWKAPVPLSAPYDMEVCDED